LLGVAGTRTAAIAAFEAEATIVIVLAVGAGSRIRRAFACVAVGVVGPFFVRLASVAIELAITCTDAGAVGRAVIGARPA
jgi:hypothetical protein